MANRLAAILRTIGNPTWKFSGKDKAHKHKTNFSGDCPAGGGSPDRGQGSKVYVLCAEPKEHKHFRPGTWPGDEVPGREDR